MQLNNLRYLLALEREAHFARAAKACNVSQPSLSAGIAALEGFVGHRLVVRDQRYAGLTPEGKAILPWARQIMAAVEGLTQVASSAPGILRGELRLGIIPAALPTASVFAAALAQSHREVQLAVTSLTSREIARRLAEHDLDAGITYLEHEPPANVISVPLYRERAMFVTAAAGPSGAGRAIAWETALAQPLCLLHQGMQNRRILDANLAVRGLIARPQVTADSYVTLLALVRTGNYATIMPDSYRPLLPDWARLTLFAEPLPASSVGLIVSARAPLAPLAAAAIALGRSIATDSESLSQIA